MSLREALNKNKSAAAGVFVGLLALGAVAGYLISRPGEEEASVQSRVFYTVDEGKTWFADDVQKLYPFDHQGKLAYRVQIFRCGPKGEPFAGYLQRINEAALKTALAAQAEKKSWDDIAPLFEPSLEVKKPTDTDWVQARGGPGDAATSVKCPPTQYPMVVLP